MNKYIYSFFWLQLAQRKKPVKVSCASADAGTSGTSSGKIQGKKKPVVVSCASAVASTSSGTSTGKIQVSLHSCRLYNKRLQLPIFQEADDTLNRETDLNTSEDEVREKNKPEGKKRKRLHRFNTTWLDVREFKDWLIRSDKYKKDESLIEYGMCKVCNVEIFPNKNDILRHGKTEKHTSLLKTVKGNRDMRDMMKDQSQFYSVKNAEIILAATITELNISFNSMDKLLFTKMFPDSKIAKDFSCKRTKTTLIVKENLPRRAFYLVSKLFFFFH